MEWIGLLPLFFYFRCRNIKYQLRLQKIFGPIVCRVRVTQLRWRLSAKRLGGHLKKDKIIFQSALDLLFPFLPSIRFSFETLQRTLCNDGDKPSLQLYRTQVIFLWWQNLKLGKILFVNRKKLVKWKCFAIWIISANVYLLCLTIAEIYCQKEFK